MKKSNTVSSGSGSSKKKKSVQYIVAVVLLGLIAAGVWQYLELRNENQELQTTLNEKTAELDELKSELVTDPNTAVSKIQQEQNSSILDEISKVYAIPEDETPTIATVQDVSKLADQTFFEGAQNGDILVVFSNSSQAVLYRPDTKQLVKVGPISTGASNEQTTSSGSSSEE